MNVTFVVNCQLLKIMLRLLLICSVLTFVVCERDVDKSRVARQVTTIPQCTVECVCTELKRPVACCIGDSCRCMPGKFRCPSSATAATFLGNTNDGDAVRNKRSSGDKEREEKCKKQCKKQGYKKGKSVYNKRTFQSTCTCSSS